MRRAFGDLTNAAPLSSCPFPDGVETEDTELFFGVSKPFFSNTYKKREKKSTKKRDQKLKADQENIPEKKSADIEMKKEKPKARTQKNNEQKLALQHEFQKDPTWSNTQCKRIS